jgi:pilus assembly protein CpaE
MKSSMDFPHERVPRAALISPDATLRSLLTSCLDEAAPAIEWVLRAESDVTELRPESVERLAERNPEVLFLDVGSSPSAGVRFISAVTTRLPGLTVVAAGGALGVDELLDLIRAGASGYVRRPWSREEVTGVCTNLLRKMPGKPVEEEVTPQVGMSRVIALFAPKGGTGVSTLAANLATHIRRATSKRTLLLDLSPELGTCSVLMGVEPRYSYLDVTDSLQRMDERLLYSFLEEHESGAWVLASPGGAATGRALDPESVSAIMRLARRYFEYVVVDVGRSIIDAAAMKALELSDERLVVTTAELPTLRNVKQVLPHVPLPHDRADASDKAIHLVVNRYEEGVSVPKADIERAVGLPLSQVLQEDRERVGRSVNLGQPVVALKSSSPYARSVQQLGDRLAAEDLNGNGKRSAFAGLLRTLLPPFARPNGDGEPANGRRHQAPANGHAAADARSGAVEVRRPPHGRSDHHKGPGRGRVPQEAGAR